MNGQVEYWKDVSGFMRDRSRQSIITSTNPENVAVTYTEFLGKAERNVYFYHPNLQPEIFDLPIVTNALRYALMKNKVVELITTVPEDPGKFISILEEFYRGTPFTSVYDLSRHPRGDTSDFKNLELAVMDNVNVRQNFPNDSSLHSSTFFNFQEGANSATIFFDRTKAQIIEPNWHLKKRPA